MDFLPGYRDLISESLRQLSTLGPGQMSSMQQTYLPLSETGEAGKPFMPPPPPGKGNNPVMPATPQMAPINITNSYSYSMPGPSTPQAPGLPSPSRPMASMPPMAPPPSTGPPGAAMTPPRPVGNGPSNPMPPSRGSQPVSTMPVNSGPTTYNFNGRTIPVYYTGGSSNPWGVPTTPVFTR